MPNLPTGTVAFLFTDIEGSTKLWEQHPEAMRAALTRHDTLLRQAIEENSGVVVKSTGDGILAAFATAPDGLAAALSVQRAMLTESWPDQTPIRVRAALHVGTAEYRDGDYYGSTLNRAARLLATGHGGQVLLSQTTYDLVRDCLPADSGLQNMGQHRLKDLLAPEQVWQLLHSSLPSGFPLLKSLDYLPTNLPRQMTSFIGRGQEMAEVKRLLPSTLLLTLLGTGGTGKTRLALQVGADVLDDYKDGVWLVELAALSDPDLVPQTVATALGLREEAGRPLRQTVQDYLRDRQLLLILDNCEHLLDACARMADALLKNCPHLTILATSREALGIAGERPWRMPSLLTPGPADLPPEEKDVAAVLMEYDACRLFVERALLQRQDFVLTRGNAPVVAHLCQQLDGIPLAIELAAARVRSMPVEQIEARVHDRFRLLTGGSRTALPRQQTLRALIDWSYDLLNENEKALLLRLSVFAGGWSLEAAEKVCAGAEIEEWEMPDLLTALVDKSLVVYGEQQGEARYRLLETVRQYAADRLVESGEGGTYRTGHRDYFLALAEETQEKLSGPEQVKWLDRLETEHDNLRQALTFCLEDAQGARMGLRLGADLQHFWKIRGHLSEGRERLTVLLARPEAREHTKERASALNGAGVFSFSQGDYASARLLHEQSLEIRWELSDRRGIAISLNNLANVARFQGDYASARSLYEESLDILRELGDRWRIAASLDNLGNVACCQGDYASARTLHEQSLEIVRELGNGHGIAASLNNLGNVAYGQGDYASARSQYEGSLEIFKEMGDRQGIAVSLESFARFSAVEGKQEPAARLWGAAERLREEIGSPLPANERDQHDRDVATAHQTMSATVFSAAWTEGRAMTMEQAIEYALKVEED